MIEMTLQGWNLLKEVGFTKDGFFYVVDVVDLAQEPRNENRSRCTANHIISIFRPIPESLRVRCCNCGDAAVELRRNPVRYVAPANRCEAVATSGSNAITTRTITPAAPAVTRETHLEPGPWPATQAECGRCLCSPTRTPTRARSGMNMQRRDHLASGVPGREDTWASSTPTG